MRLIVHGGAGGRPDDPEPRRAVLDEAAATGAGESTPLDAVEAAVNVLEADERFNAGVGGAVQSDGVVRTDAGLMTSDRAVGAVAGTEGVRDAVSAARVVLAETPHVLVTGDRAVDLAAAFGVETGVDLTTDRSRERWADADPPTGDPEAHLRWMDEVWGGHESAAEGGGDGSSSSADPDGRSSPPETTDSGGSPSPPETTDSGGSPSPPETTDHDTVGAVATDGESFAAATSTGGRWFALAGRVGDVPQTGAGFYAAPAGAASATGHGEDIARATLSRRAVGLLEAGLDADRAADRAIAEFAELTGAEAGLIVLGRDGGSGAAFNSDGMQTATAFER
jgi:beta-aspartyl-peptidase (threonine type)